MKNRVVVADDQTVFCERLRRELEPEFCVVAFVRDGESLVQACDLFDPDIVICDFEVPIIDGREAVRRLRDNRFLGRVVLLSRGAQDTRTDPISNEQARDEQAWNPGVDIVAQKEMGAAAIVRALR